MERSRRNHGWGQEKGGDEGGEEVHGVKEEKGT